MGIENREGKKPESEMEKAARRVRPELVRDKASKMLVENLAQKLTSKDIDLRDQTGEPVSLNLSEDIGMRINNEGNVVLAQEMPESGIEQIATKSDNRQSELLKKMGAEKLVEFANKMSPEKKEAYLEDLADKQMSYQEKLEKAELMLKEAETQKEKNAIEKQIAESRDMRDGYELLISAIEKGGTDIKRAEFKTKRKLEQEIIIPAEITKEIFTGLPKELQKQYLSNIEETIDAGEKIIEDYKEILNAEDVTDEEKKEAQTRIREEQTEIDAKQKLIANLK